MDIYKIGIIGIIATILIVTIKQQVPQIAILISLVTGIIIFISIFSYLKQTVGILLKIIGTMNINIEYIDIILKIIGISYISEFCSQICSDSGQNSIASKIDLAGKIVIMVISLPIIVSILDLINQLLP